MKTLTTLAAITAFTLIATPAAAQSTGVRVQIDTQAIREATDEIRAVLRDVLGPNARLELQQELRSLSRDISELVRDVSREVSREFSSDIERAWGRTARGVQRNFNASQTDKETRTFAVGANGEFDLENLAGDIRVQVGGGRNISVEIIRNARGRSEADARNGLSRVRVETVHRGDRVTVRTIYPNERQNNYNVGVDFVVTMPAGTRVNARTLSGDVSVTGVQGEVQVTTMSGDLVIVDVPRLATAKTTSGDVTLRNVGAEAVLSASTTSGDVVATGIKTRRLELTSVSGDVTLRNVQATDVRLVSTSGDLLYDGDLQANGRYTLQTHSGTAQLAVDGRTGFTLEASTFTGTVRTDLPLQMSRFGSEGRRPARNVRGTFGDGSAVVNATSFSGNVIITKR